MSTAGTLYTGLKIQYQNNYSTKIENLAIDYLVMEYLVLKYLFTIDYLQ